MVREAAVGIGAIGPGGLGQRGEQHDGLAQFSQGGDALGAGVEVGLDPEDLVHVHRVEGVGGQEGLDGVVIDHAHCSLRSVFTVSAMRASASRRRDLAVPSGMPRASATWR